MVAKQQWEDTSCPSPAAKCIPIFFFFFFFVSCLFIYFILFLKVGRVEFLPHPTQAGWVMCTGGTANSNAPLSVCCTLWCDHHFINFASYTWARTMVKPGTLISSLTLALKLCGETIPESMSCNILVVGRNLFFCSPDQIFVQRRDWSFGYTSVCHLHIHCL